MKRHHYLLLFLVTITFVQPTELLGQWRKVQRDYIEIPVDLENVVKQDSLGKNTCVPSAVMNAMMLGTSETKDILNNMPGKDLEAKAKAYFANCVTKPSIIRKNQKRYEGAGEAGIHFFDVAPIYREAGAPEKVKVMQLHKLPDESNNEHVVRVHKLLRQSMLQNVPVIISALLIKADRDKEAEALNWHTIMAHAMVVTSIPDKILPGEDGFSVKLLDSGTGKNLDGYIGIERVRGFQSPVYRNLTEETNDWKVGSALMLNCPGMDIGQGNIAWHRRTMTVLMFGCGLFD